MRRATILAFVLVAGSALSLGQDRALISGDAEDKQDTPVPDVRVTLRNESLRIERTTTTNSDGLYFFAEVTPAEGYVISAEAPGMAFAPQNLRFEVQVGETRHLLPSFIAEKQAALASRLHDGQQPEVPYRMQQEPSARCAVDNAAESGATGTYEWLPGCHQPRALYQYAGQSARHQSERTAGVANRFPRGPRIDSPELSTRTLSGAHVANLAALVRLREELEMNRAHSCNGG